MEFFALLLLAAAGTWLLAVALFAAIVEAPGATQGGGNALVAALQSLSLLRSDVELRRFVVARALLLSVALAPPFYVLLAQQRSAGVTGLGLLIVASGLASSLSAPLWGRMGDRSSRRVMVIGAAAAGGLGLATWMLETAGLPLMDSPWTYAGLFLLIAVFHSGVRLGRKVYLVDMATQDSRSAYVAISNTVIGAAMLAGGAVGLVADLLQSAAVIALLGVVSLFAAFYIARLPEVSG
jgi:MFS family permease